MDFRDWSSDRLILHLRDLYDMVYLDHNRLALVRYRAVMRELSRRGYKIT